MCTRRIAASSSFAILILILWVSQIWVFCCFSQARASRIFPPPPPPPPPPHTTDKTDHANRRYELLQKYFKDRAFLDPHRHHEGFVDSKRKIPSCPDPLHN
ncbi:CLAVATA3/ESR (CLE)-related protein 27, partial [Cucurbita argyrosperma subsp. sororia]